MRIYIAGPITGYDLNERVATFKAAAEHLEHELGAEPVNPLELHPLDISWEDALRADIAGLITCRGIYLLKGYQHSKGAMLELHIARELGLEEFYEDHAETVLEEAERIVAGDRGPQYGHPTANFKLTAALWSAYKGIDFTLEDVAVCMILLKIARAKHRSKRDHIVDVGGYTKTWAMVKEYE